MSVPSDPVPPDVPDGLVRSMPATLADQELDGVLVEGFAAPGSRADGVQISEGRLIDADLSHASLTRAAIQDVEWIGGSLANAHFGDARISRARFEKVRATGLDLTRCALDNVAFVGCRLDLALLRASILNSVRLEDCRLEDADFFEARFTSVVFDGCGLRSANWAGASFSKSELRGCDLTGGVSLDRLRGVRMPWDDVIRSAGEIAIAAGIEIVE
jgi:uncharacterized protein YjbI with pentapeptide repeats